MNWRASARRLIPRSGRFRSPGLAILILVAALLLGTGIGALTGAREAPVNTALVNAGQNAPGSAPGSAHTGSPQANSSRGIPVYYAPVWQPQIRPTAIYWGAGGSLFTKPLRWTRWNDTSAFADSTLWFNNCVPDCAKGSFAKYPDTVELTRVRRHGGRSYYTRLTVRYTKNGTPVTQTYQLGGQGPE